MYPRKKKLFDAWTKAMVAGATVDKPDYSTTAPNPNKRANYGGRRSQRHRHRMKRRKKAKDG